MRRSGIRLLGGRMSAAALGEIFPYWPRPVYSREKSPRGARGPPGPLRGACRGQLHAPARPDLTVIIYIVKVRCGRRA